MKKLLAMVLALVMTLSLAVSANAFTDDSKVNDSYAEAVAVLNGMGVFKGYEDGSFKPEGDITRAEVATIVYRIYTADVAKNDKSGLYASYNKFSDMAGASWAAGYIGYCANAELVKGYPDGTFKPSGKVTGYEVLAMILRAVGYDKNGEFSGADWALHVAQTAQQADMLKNVKGVDLNAAASRELVAELLFRGIQASTVTYTPAFGYVTDKVINTASTTIGVKNFKLDKADTADKWGRPGTLWTYSTGDKKTTVLDKPVVSYTKAVAECDVAHDAGLTADTAYALYVNGDKQIAKYIVNLTDTVTKMGAQGRLVEVYDDTIVMIDTFLAKVNNVYDAVYDAQGHLKTEATIVLTVYDGSNTTLTLKNGETNYTYVKGDYVLVNAYTAKNSNSATASGAVNGNYGEIVGKADSIEGAQSVLYWNAKQHNVEGTVYDDAYKFLHDEAGTSTAKYTWFFDQYGNLIGSVEIEAATSYGVITRMWWAGNVADGSGVAKANVTYMDGTTGTVDIGKMTFVAIAKKGQTVTKSVVAGTPTYSVIDSDIMSVKGYTAATVSSKEVVGKFYVTTDADTNARIDYNKAGDEGLINGHLYQFKTNSNGTVNAVEVANETGASFKNPTMVVYKDTQINSNGLVANDNTTYLIRTGSYADGYTYTKVTGFRAIDNFDEGEVDFVLSNGVAQYVFITADATSAKSTSVFFYVGGQATYDYKTEMWTIPGYVDGVEGKVLAEGRNSTYADKILDLTTGRGDVNTLWCVTLNNNKITGIWSYSNDSTLREATGDDGIVYPLASAYQGLNEVKVRVIEGNVRDDYDGSLYRHDSTPNSVNATYSDNDIFAVVDNAAIKSQVNGDWSALGDKLIYVAYVSGVGQYQRAIVHATIIDNNKAVLPSTYYIKSITLNALTAPRLHSNVADYVAPAAVWSSSDGKADNASLKVSVEWTKWNGSDYVAYTNPSFDAGDYQAVITLSVDNTNNTNSYVIDSRTAITYNGTAMTSATFVTGNINIH